MPIAPQDRRSLPRALEPVAAVLDDLGVGGVPGEARDRAQEHAQGLLDAYGGGADGIAVAVVAYAAELVGLVADERAADPAEIRRLADALQARAGVPRVALGRELLRARRPAELPVSDALQAQLALLRALTGARAVALWAEQTDADPRRVAHAGELDTGPSPDEETVSLRIAARPVPGALQIHGVDPHAPELGPLLAAAAPGIAGLLERETLRDREHWRELVAGAVERRLARLRFDLHDGPQQDVILLAQDVRMFREQLRPLLDGEPDQARALGRLDDLEAQLLALDGDLRRLSTSVQSPFLSPGSLLESLQRVAAAFAQRTGILPETEFSADLTQLSESQEIALLALVQEALSNVRKHGDASAVRIAITPDPDGIRAQVSDDGRGFDPETTVAHAARAGRLGLVGMHERVRMLGGQTQIDSKPGGPTVVSAVLPRWGGEDDD
ncbi:MAG TPA: ATP-binding protein [Solirubrobacteraceae bacterium]|nr:ATP-binding protein [Solirubrobacteraceae bacterium]